MADERNPRIPSRAARDVLTERCRQVEVEGWTPEHDDQYTRMELPRAACCYALVNTLPVPTKWPWAAEWWKPSEDHRRNLVKAAALLIAEIERLDRA